MRPLSRSILLLALSAGAIAMLAVACGGDDGYGSTSPTKSAAVTSSTTPSATTANGASGGPSTKVVSVADTGKGKVIADLTGMTLYTFKPDASAAGKSACTGSCATTWPPMTSNSGVPAQLDGATGSFATIMRDDGVTQVTFNNLPLYHFSGDKKAGDTNGDGVGGVWFVALASGPAAAASPTTAPVQPTATTAPSAPTVAPTAPKPTPTTDPYPAGGYNY